MKILHVLDHSLPLHSGYTFRSQNIFREQRKRGWQAVVLTSPKHEENWRGPWEAKELINGFHYYRTGALRGNGIPLQGETRLITALAKRIEQVVRLEKPDLLHAHSPMLNAISALWVGRKLKIPVVYEIRAFWEDAGVDHGTYTQDSAKYRLVRFLETWVCRHADCVGVLCEGLRQDLIKRGIRANKVSVIYNGVNPDDFSFIQPDDEFRNAWNLEGRTVIGFIGSFYRYEGLDLLVEAFARLAARRPDVVLLLVGGGEVQNELKNQIQRLGLALETDAGKLGGWEAGRLQREATRNSQLATRIQSQVLMPGRIPHDRIAGVYSLMDVLAYPRYSMRLTELVTPLKPLEAMAMGKALVASDIGGHKELIRDGETGLLFPPGDVSALGEALEKLMDDDDLRHRLASQGKKWVRQHHTWEKTTAVYQGMYEKALGGGEARKRGLWEA